MQSSTPSSSLLEVEDLAVSYGRIDALQALSLRAENASLTVVLGPNGAGKTTLMKALAGILRPRQGTVRLAGRDVTRMPAFRRVAQGVALVPEGRGRLPGLSVRDNLLLGWEAAPPQRRTTFAGDVEAIVDLFPVLRDRYAQDCSTLSGGEMQMLAIARALLSKPQVLLLDEPSLGLAPLAVGRVYEALSRLLAGGLSMILVEQMAVPLTAERETTLVLRNGRVVLQSNTRPSTQTLADLYLGSATA